MSADTLQALSLSAEGAFSTLVRSTSAQVAELKSLACLRAGAAVGAGDIRALADRASAVEALLTELATHVQEEETAMEELQAYVEQATAMRDATAYMRSHLPFNLPGTVGVAASSRARRA